jgi:intracellular sulfur oxidation DsrE/DsrF family protein
MEKNNLSNQTDRRQFLGSITAGAATLGLASLFQPLQAGANDNIPGFNPDDPDAWFKPLKAKKHSIVFDATKPHGIMPFVWPRVFLLTNAATGSAEKDCGVVVVLRHDAIPYAFEDRLWPKYKFSEVFKESGDLGPAFQATDAATAATMRNPFWKPKPGDFKAPGFGNVAIGINELQASGVMFCVCNAAMTVYSNAIAMQTNGDAKEIMKDWVAGLLPGVQVVPSGVWAVGRAQENGCQYCFAG